MRIKVEDYHIRNGQPRCLEGCPIAIAITPRLPAGHYALVEERYIHIRDRVGKGARANEKLIQTPPEAVAFLLDVDAGRPVKSFEFDLDLTTDR